eukprot:gnl/MRDRNA2_/MRDRNA2_84772_c1_seq1.p1 gnl/MRDRNA2_/MRDRNA2_84772_c1~~gnl/MRDRNA2_/MRDRNA2_84772_c1_seq1.p1  ORF type:complete len:114 (-),score=35.16 gnl/MRDRNA2_/MRDRNA2_84772_c1_seq1:40-381(-)
MGQECSTLQPADTCSSLQSAASSLDHGFKEQAAHLASCSEAGYHVQQKIEALPGHDAPVLEEDFETERVEVMYILPVLEDSDARCPQSAVAQQAVAGQDSKEHQGALETTFDG